MVVLEKFPSKTTVERRKTYNQCEMTRNTQSIKKQQLTCEI